MRARLLACVVLALLTLAGAALAFVPPGLSAAILQHREAAAAALVVSVLGLAAAARMRRRLAARNVHFERALAESEHRFRDLVDLLPEVVFETDARGRLVYLNRKARELTGYDDDDLARGVTALDLVAPEERTRCRENMAAVAGGHDLGHNEYAGLRKDGTTFPVTVHSRPILRDGAFSGLRGTVLDITERKRTEQALREAMQEAEVASRAKSEFLAAVSHELRTPLNAIIGFSDMMASGTHGPLGNTRYAEYIRDIRDSGQHLLALINDILDLAKIEAGKDELARQPVMVAETVRGALALVRQRALAGGVAIEIDLEPALPALDADPRKMKQVFVNLVANAIKFTEPGGTVTIRGARTEDGGIELSVADTGIGIAPEDIPKALSQFGQVKKDPAFAQQGTGLGLPLAKAIVERHGGTLGLESEPGVGTTVRLAFPPACLIEDAPMLAALAAAG